MGLNNFFKQNTGRAAASKASQGQAGFDNPRENIDPHIKTKVVNSKEAITFSSKSETIRNSGAILMNNRISEGWGSDFNYIAIGETASINSKKSGSSTGQIGFSNKHFFDGTNWISNKTGQAGLVSISPNGDLFFYNAASTASGAVVTFNPIISVDGSERILRVLGDGMSGGVLIGSIGHAHVYASGVDMHIKCSGANGDIVFNINNGGTDTRLMRLDGGNGNVVLDGPYTFAQGQLYISPSAANTDAGLTINAQANRQPIIYFKKAAVTKYGLFVGAGAADDLEILNYTTSNSTYALRIKKTNCQVHFPFANSGGSYIMVGDYPALWNSGAHLYVSAANIFCNTNLTTRGDLINYSGALFSGATCGYPFGYVDGFELGLALNNLTQGQTYKIFSGAMTNLTNNFSYEDGCLVCKHTGYYSLRFSGTLESNVANKHYYLGVALSGATISMQSGAIMHVEAPFANQEDGFCGNGIIRFNAGDKICLAINCLDAGNPNVIIDHTNFVLTQEG